MSFLHIKDPVKRNETVAEYFLQRNKSNATDIDQSYKNNEAKKHYKEPLVYHSKEDARLSSIPVSKTDRYFGISKQSNGLYRMGNVNIELKDGNIITPAGIQYPGTNGLWNLIMLKTPLNYTDKDMEMYLQLIKQTDIMNHPNNLNSKSKPKSTYKWRHIFSKVQNNKGIIFLPGDIKGLQTKLDYLIGEYRAGNTVATHNQIVAIADELLRRKHISQEQYNNINKIIQNVTSA